jgi:outer membrane protein, heavy metal efflux system
MSSTVPRTVALVILPTFLVLSVPVGSAFGQAPARETGIVSNSDGRRMTGLPVVPGAAGASSGLPPSSTTSLYHDAVQGSSSSELVRRALASNSELAALRLNIERARARLQQAGMRPNPTFDFEQTTGRLTGSQGERETSIGFALPLDVNGQRRRRIDLARAEFEAAEAEVADRERRLIAEVRASHAEVLAALRELEITAELTNLDQQTARVVEVRVTEGDSAPIELNLLRSEVDRLSARRALVEGRLQSSLLRLKNLAGIPPGEPLRLSENLNTQILPEPATSVEDAVGIALRTRPDLRFARLTEEVAQAGLRLARAQRSAGRYCVHQVHKKQCGI